MNRILSFLLLLMLVSCANPEATENPITVVNTKVIETNTFPSPTLVPSVTPTQPQDPPCDPFSADFCISEGHFILQRPIHPPANDLIDATYPYGSTANGTRDPHHGVEFSNPSGTHVYAAAEGTVLFAGADTEAIYAPWPNYYGNLVVIKHEDDLFTLYAHLSHIDVESGQNVAAGDRIAEVGSTGVAIGSHLHFEVRQGDVQDYFETQNPELWLSSATDTSGAPFGVLMISVRDEHRNLVKYAKLTIEYHPEKPDLPTKTYYGTTYSSDLLNGDENAVLGELSAGRYRIAVNADGKMDERWVEVESGMLTQVVFVVK